MGGFRRVAWVAAGGALGSVLRVGVAARVAELAGAGFPWGTLTVNILGSGLLGWLSGRLLRSHASADLRGFATAGVCGGFTTFSAFDLETFQLLEAGRWAAAAAYSLGSVAACVAAIVVGLRLAGRPFPEPTREGNR